MNVKYGIIGCGGISQLYFDGLQKIGTQIAHVADIGEERAKVCGKAVNAKASIDYRVLIDDPNVSVVIILAHTKFHKEMCLAAIEAGKNVICEKTLATNVEEAYQIAKAAQDKKVFFFTAYMKRFFPAVQKARELMTSLGVVYSAYFRSFQFWGNLYEDTGDLPAHIWLDRYDGGVLKCAGSHMLDLILFLMGRPEKLYANISYVEEKELDRKATAMLEYSGPLVVNFEAAGHSLSRIGYFHNNWDERIEINGTKGRLDIYLPTWDKPQENAALLVYYDENSQTSTEYRFEAENNFYVQLEYFHKCIEERKNGYPNAVDGFNVDAIISAISDSSKQRKMVEIDWKGL